MKRTLCAFAVVGQVIFVLGWAIGGTLQGHGYSVARHDISDLSALTAHAPWVMITGQTIGGISTILFAIFVLRSALRAPGRREALGPYFVALALVGLDNLSDTFFRLDCRAADAGCSPSVAAASWHGKIHVYVAAVSAVATLLAPFVLARRMRLLPAWKDLARPAVVFGVAFVALIVLYSAIPSAAGYSQRAAALMVCSGVVVLARRAART